MTVMPPSRSARGWISNCGSRGSTILRTWPLLSTASKQYTNKKHPSHDECFFVTGDYLSSQAVSNQVLSAYMGLTTVFGMGTGGTPSYRHRIYKVNIH